MKPRLRHIRREVLCIGMAFLLIMLIPTTGLKSISIPVVQAQGGEPTLTLSGLQFDGARYYFMFNMLAEGYISITWQIYVNSATDQVANEIVEAGVGVDSSVFYEGIPGCFGFNDCDSICNACVSNGTSLCKAVAIGAATLAGIAISRVCATCIFGSGAITPVSVACTIGCAIVILAVGGGIYAAYLICKNAVPGTCSNNNPPCHCKLL